MNEYNKMDVYTYNGKDYPFNFRTHLNIGQKMQFVEDFSDLVIIDDNYYSIIKDVVFDFMIIRMFTDVDTYFVEDEDLNVNFNLIESIVNETDIVEIVKENIDGEVLEELWESVNLNIEYKTGIHKNIFDEILVEVVKAFKGMSSELTAEKLLEAYAKSDMYKSNWDNANKSFLNEV